MAELRVWAPTATAVALDCQGSRTALHQSAHGWWILETPLLEHGVDYGLLVNGRGPLPDPRSCWQPAGVHGLSRWVDHARFAWTDTAWQPPPLASAVIYELHVGTFTRKGTFMAAIERLDHLVDLGVTHVELMPVAAYPGTHGWGYDGVDLYAPHAPYGGPEGLKGLVDACHRRGLAVLLDVVYNHLGPSGNYIGCFGPYFTDRYATPWGQGVNLDGPDSDEVRRFFIDNALMWLRDYHFDGLRIDAVHALVDTSAIHFLEQLAAEVARLGAALGRHLVLIAESDLNDPRIVRPAALGGYGLDSQWNEDFHHALHAALTGERSGYYLDFGRLADLAKVLTRGLAYDGCPSQYRRRCHGRPAQDLPGFRFVGCLQNHDQVGNRARGERTSHLLTPGLCKVGAALVLTSPFVPMLFQGEEWGASTPFLYFTDHQEAELAEAVCQGRRREFSAFAWNPEEIPDPQATSTFFRSKLDWTEIHRPPHGDILAWHRNLISLRSRLPALRDERLSQVAVRHGETARWMVIHRGPVLIVCNLNEKAQSIPCPEAGEAQILLASAPGVTVGAESIRLPGHAAAILGP